MFGISYVATDMVHDLKLRTDQISGFLLSSGIGFLIGAFLLGRLADQRGRRPALMRLQPGCQLGDDVALIGAPKQTGSGIGELFADRLAAVTPIIWLLMIVSLTTLFFSAAGSCLSCAKWD